MGSLDLSDLRALRGYILKDLLVWGFGAWMEAKFANGYVRILEIHKTLMFTQNLFLFHN